MVPLISGIPPQYGPAKTSTESLKTQVVTSLSNALGYVFFFVGTPRQVQKQLCQPVQTYGSASPWHKARSNQMDTPIVIVIALMITSIAIGLDFLTVVDSRLQLSNVRVEERGRGSTSRSTMPQSCLVKCAPQVVLRCSPLEFHWTLASTWRHHPKP